MLRSELCAAANVSERTLQYAFHDIMGMSPLTYLHRLRLHRARGELRKAKNGSTTVTDVAMNWGFWQGVAITFIAGVLVAAISYYFFPGS